MLMTEAVDAYLYLSRLTVERAIAESDDSEVGEIAAKAALGDGNAIGQMFVRYQRPLTRIAAAIVGQDLAQDAVSETFIRLTKGSFAQHAEKFRDGRTAWLMLARTTTNISKDFLKRRRETPVAMGTGADDVDDREMDPVDKSAGPSRKELETVHAALTRAKEKAKLSPEEKQFVDMLLSTGMKLSGGKTDADGKTSIKDLAIQIWPDKKPNAAEVSAVRARKRFLKQLCLDPEIKALLPTGRTRDAKSSFFGKNFKPLCDEQTNPVGWFAEQIGLNFTADPDGTYDAVLRWVYHRVT